ncbi:transposase [Streptomyces sp. NPDC005803]|uniref:transposase n=1 Tax=Streptomyces sp. NPDC005803 TaxID=3154297 RepID=UPI0033E9423B
MAGNWAGGGIGGPSHCPGNSNRVDSVRNVFSAIPKGAAERVAAAIRTLFAQSTGGAVRAHLATVADVLGKQFLKVRKMLLHANPRNSPLYTAESSNVFALRETGRNKGFQKHRIQRDPSLRPATDHDHVLISTLMRKLDDAR